MSFDEFKVRLLYLPDERGDGRQVGPRDAFEGMVTDGWLADYEAFAPWREADRHGVADTHARLLETAERFRPDMVLWQHVADFPVTGAQLRALKGVSSRPKLVYHEGDAYGTLVNRITTSARVIMREADLVVMAGLGPLARRARRAGAKLVRHVPSNFDNIRFGQPWTATRTRRYDVVMIANRNTTRLPGVYLPGGRQRDRLVRALSNQLGDRYAIYGAGWEDVPGAKGPAAFDDQEIVIRNAWVTINWDHYQGAAFYFSDRLPISLAAGVPVVTAYHPGFELLFRGCDGLFPVRSVREALDTVSWLLSMPAERLIELGQAAHSFACEHLEAKKVYNDLISVCIRELFQPPS